jgi:hypothetical protein
MTPVTKTGAPGHALCNEVIFNCSKKRRIDTMNAKLPEQCSPVMAK